MRSCSSSVMAVIVRRIPTVWVSMTYRQGHGTVTDVKFNVLCCQCLSSLLPSGVAAIALEPPKSDSRAGTNSTPFTGPVSGSQYGITWTLTLTSHLMMNRPPSAVRGFFPGRKPVDRTRGPVVAGRWPLLGISTLKLLDRPVPAPRGCHRQSPSLWRK